MAAAEEIASNDPHREIPAATQHRRCTAASNRAQAGAQAPRHEWPRRRYPPRRRWLGSTARQQGRDRLLWYRRTPMQSIAAATESTAKLVELTRHLGHSSQAKTLGAIAMSVARAITWDTGALAILTRMGEDDWRRDERGAPAHDAHSKGRR